MSINVEECVKELLETRFPKTRNRKVLAWRLKYGDKIADEIQRLFNVKRTEIIVKRGWVS